MTIDVQIRRPRLEDVDALYEAIVESKPELIRWMSWCHAQYSRAETLARLESRPLAWERNEEWGFLIVDADDRILGSCGLHRLDLRNGVAELGYWVRSSRTRQGIATAATRRLCEWAFDEQGLDRIEILANVDNVASQRVAEKAGGVREGILRQRVRHQGQRQDCLLFAVLKS